MHAYLFFLFDGGVLYMLIKHLFKYACIFFLPDVGVFGLLN